MVFFQSSILGLMLFLIFVKELKNSTKVLGLALFQDDTNLFWSDSEIRAVFETGNQELGQISYWFLANKLSLNLEKTKYMLFYKLTDQENGKIIERENSFKFLGAILDECLTWKKTYTTYWN